MGQGARTAPEARGERPTSEDLFDAYYGQLAGWTYRLVGDEDVAHEIATEAFTRLVARWRTVREPRPWLYLVAANLVRDRWRTLGRERAAYARVAAAETTLPLGGAEDLALRVTVRELVLALPERMRVPVLLHYYADLPVAQVAELIGKAEGTVKRALFDARALMARELQEAR